MRYGTLALTAIALLALGTHAHASLNVNLDSTTASGSNTMFNYSIASATNDVIRNGDFFRIYDFGGYVAGSVTAPADWTTAVQFSNPTPPPNVLLTYGDDPAIPNLIFTYTGSTLSGPTTISGFSADTFSYTGKFTLKDFAARIGNTSGGNSDSVGANAVAPDAPPPTVPEPGSVALFVGLGISGSVFLARRRKQTK